MVMLLSTSLGALAGACFQAMNHCNRRGLTLSTAVGYDARMEVNTTTHISVDEARRRLGITRQGVHKLIATGKLRGTRHEIAGRATWTVDAESVAARQKEGRPEAA